MKRNSGSTATTVIDPGGEGSSLEMKGWSIQPPQSANLYGIPPITSAMSFIVLLLMKS